MSVYEKIAQLGITLPEVTPPVAAFVPFVRSGNQIFVSRHIAKENGKPWVGKLRLNITTELGNRAARSIAIDLLATLNLAVEMFAPRRCCLNALRPSASLPGESRRSRRHIGDHPGEILFGS